MKVRWLLPVALTAALTAALMAVIFVGGGDNGDKGPAGGPRATATATAAAGQTPGPVVVVPTGPAGTPGNSPQEPLEFPATRSYGEVDLTAERWELINCLPPSVTPTAQGDECPQQPLAGNYVRFYVTVTNNSTTEAVSGRFDFVLVTIGTVYAVFEPDQPDTFAATTKSLGPGEKLEGWVYSVRPEPDILDSGDVRIQATIGPTLAPKVALWWKAPLP